MERSDRSEPLHRCSVCSSSVIGDVVYRFRTGVDAPVSVIATELYQSLPPSTDSQQREKVGEGRKLLSFADSRQDAAFFAPYLNRTYERAVTRGVTFDVVKERQVDGAHPRFGDVTSAVLHHAEQSLLLDPDEGRVANISEVNFWVAREMLALDRRQSLDGLGLVDIRPAFPRRCNPPTALLDAGLSGAESMEVIRVLLDSLRRQGAVSLPDGVDIRHERFAPRNVDVSVRERGSETGVVAWVPGGHSLNRRADFLQKVLARKGLSVDAVTVLERLWVELTDLEGNWAPLLVSFSKSKKHGVVFKLNHERLEFALGTDSNPPLKCSSCRMIWWRSVAGVCPSWRCQGTLHAITDRSDVKKTITPGFTER